MLTPDLWYPRAEARRWPQATFLSWTTTALLIVSSCATICVAARNSSWRTLDAELEVLRAVVASARANLAGGESVQRELAHALDVMQVLEAQRARQNHFAVLLDDASEAAAAARREIDAAAAGDIPDEEEEVGGERYSMRAWRLQLSPSSTPFELVFLPPTADAADKA